MIGGAFFGPMLLALALTRGDAYAGVATGLVGLVMLVMVTNLLKGKIGMFLLGFLVSIVWLFGAVFEAKPDSWWARRYYKAGKFKTTARRQPKETEPGTKEILGIKLKRVDD
jgi:type IV secretory pathway VirB3-like protein